MKKTEFDALATKELKEGFLKGGESALMHFRAAGLLAENEYYQLACAHLILGGEEGVKALVFFSRMRKFLKIPFNQQYFHKHPPKHDALREAHRIWQEVLSGMFQIFHEKNSAPEWMKEADIKILHAHMQIDEKYVDDWWEKANSLKNQAFYVTKRLHGWEGPDSVTKADYVHGERVLRGLKMFLEIIHGVESKAKQRLVQQLFKELKRQTSDHDVSVFQNSGMLNRFGELGFGFFPMGKGVFAEGQSELSDCKVMILGNDFGTEVYLDGCIANGGHESVNNPTIRNLGQLGLYLETTFFTNFHLGVRKEGTNIKRVEDLKLDFTKFCFQFLKKQLEIMNPEVVICLGHDVRKALYSSSTLFKPWGPKSRSLKQLYFSTGHFALDIDDAELGKRKFIVIPHPCDTRNFSAAYVEKIKETLNKLG